MLENLNYKILILTIDEIYLKKQNNKIFTRQLLHHVRSIVKTFHEGNSNARYTERRIIIESDEIFKEKVITRLKYVPGVHSINLVLKTSLDFDAIMPLIKEELKRFDLCSTKTFKVETKRSNKSFPKNSYEISRELGGLILSEYENLKVDVINPDIKIAIRVLSDFIFIYTFSIEGVGGLPVGTLGHMVTLLSGGFDSSVASYLMSRRGVEQTFIFFHAYPFVGDEVLEKIFSLMKILVRFQRRGKIFIVPFGDIQQKISEQCRPSYRTLLFRRMMVEVATEIAKKVKANGIITGDALGQVSSQTLENLSVIDKLTPLFMARPLIGMSKNEIIKISRIIGTHDISIIPQDDACSILAPKHPVTAPNLSYWNEFKETVSFSSEIEQAVLKSKIFDINWREEKRELTI